MICVRFRQLLEKRLIESERNHSYREYYGRKEERNCDMTVTQKWFVAAAILGGLFLYQIHTINRLNEEAAVLQSRIKAFNDPWSAPNIATYCKSFFDGFTFGAFAKEGIFTECNKIDRKIGDLRDASASLMSRYQTATLYRNVSFLGALTCIIVAVVLKKKQVRQQTLQPPIAG